MLPLRGGECQRLIEAHRSAGVGRVVERDSPKYLKILREISGESISAACCRVQNNFQKFDSIVGELIEQVDEPAMHFFVIVALGRHACGAGVKGGVAFRASQSNIGAGVTIDDSDGPLPVIRNPDAREYLLPARSVIADRVLYVCRKNRPELIANCIIDLGSALAPYVVGQARNKRTHEAILAGGLLDFDRTVQRFTGNDLAEYIYSELRDSWSADSRFREQVALMHFNKFLRQRHRVDELEMAIAMARSAEGQNSSPQSKTTLAKILFASFSVKRAHSEEIFAEALDLISGGVGQEIRMSYVSSIPFTVVFSGVRDYLNLGFSLTARQRSAVESLISISNERRLSDGEMRLARDSLTSIL